jgi:hypothetical protein
LLALSQTLVPRSSRCAGITRAASSDTVTFPGESPPPTWPEALDCSGYTGYPEAMAKVLVSLNDALLRRVDRIAKSRGLSRSAYLAELAERDVARAGGSGATPAVRRALARLDELFADAAAEDSTRAIRAARDAR